MALFWPSPSNFVVIPAEDVGCVDTVEGSFALGLPWGGVDADITDAGIVVAVVDMIEFASSKLRHRIYNSVVTSQSHSLAYKSIVNYV